MNLKIQVKFKKNQKTQQNVFFITQSMLLKRKIIIKQYDGKNA